MDLRRRKVNIAKWWGRGGFSIRISKNAVHLMTAHAGKTEGLIELNAASRTCCRPELFFSRKIARAADLRAATICTALLHCVHVRP